MITAADLVEKLGGRWHKSYGMARCPAHDDRNPSLSINEGEDGRLLIRCHGGCSQHEVIDALLRLGLWRRRINWAPQLAAAESERARRDAFVEQIWRQIWREASPLRGSPIERWLQVRGIPAHNLDLECLSLRWTSRCPMGKSAAPAMVALMTDAITGEPCGIHRTFLLPDGSAKAPVEQPRMMLGRAGVIRLSADELVTKGLGICEGIETGLSIIAAGWRPVWAAGSLEAVRLFPVLAGVECLTIFADPKPREVAGAQACAKRWVANGCEVVVWKPTTGGDWNDALREAA